MKKKLSGIILAVVMAATLLTGASFVSADENPYKPTEFVEYDGAVFGRDGTSLWILSGSSGFHD